MRLTSNARHSVHSHVPDVRPQWTTEVFLKAFIGRVIESYYNVINCPLCSWSLCDNQTAIKNMVYSLKQGELIPYSHWHGGLTVILPGERGSASFTVTLPLHTSCLTPSQHVLHRQEKEQKGQWWRKEEWRERDFVVYESVSSLSSVYLFLSSLCLVNHPL